MHSTTPTLLFHPPLAMQSTYEWLMQITWFVIPYFHSQHCTIGKIM